MNQFSTPGPSRPLDHLVLPVADLTLARTRYEALGFNVATRAEHPFGTENACIFFGNGTYLEPLAIRQREICEDEARRGNVFVARDQAYRFRNQEGFSALALGTRDADADHAAFRKAGISAGDMLTFSREFSLPSGGKSEASFKLAFAADLRAPDVFFFTCERASMPSDRTMLEHHANGVSAIRRVVAVEPNPSDFQYLLQDVTGQRDIQSHSFGIDLECANATVSLLTPEGLEAFFGISRHPDGRGLRLEAVVFVVADMNRLRACLGRSGVAARSVGHRLVVDRAPGQGTILVFEEENPV